MSSFSRSAAEEMKARLRQLIGSTYGIDIKTFHSYAFELVGRRGDLERSTDIISFATKALLEEPELFPQVLMKHMIVVDEFQDIDHDQFKFLQAIIELSGDARIVVVGDDDHNIFEFRGSSVDFMREFATTPECESYFLTRNFRSNHNLVEFSNAFLDKIPGDRLKKGQKLLAFDQRAGTLEVHQYPKGTSPWSHLVHTISSIDRNKSTTAVLTRTNEQALQVEAILTDNKIPTDLVLDRKGYSVHDIIELEVFTFYLKSKAHEGTGYIKVADWQSAVNMLERTFKRSTILGQVTNCINLYGLANEHKSIFSWNDYMYSLRHDDLNSNEVEQVWISTMHKAKGKEWDSVVLFLDNVPLKQPADYRLLYVALTRAKQNLFIHTNTTYFVSSAEELGAMFSHPEQQGRMTRIYLLFGLGHIYLRSAKRLVVQKAMKQLYAGQRIALTEDRQDVQLNDDTRLRLSKMAQDQLNLKIDGGNVVKEVLIDRIVIWTDREDSENRMYRVPILKLQLELT